MGSNWFYVFGINYPVYDLKVFGQETLFIATINGLYTTNDMVSFAFQEQEQVNFSSYSLSLRWPESNFFTIPLHEAVFENIKDESGNNIGGKISTNSDRYLNLLEGRAIRLKTLDENNPKNKTSYIIETSTKDQITVSPSFNIDYEILNVEITTGSWWQGFEGEDNLNNISITNTLLLGGRNKISYTAYKDKFLWNSSLIDSEVSNFNLTNFYSVSNGFILGLANSNSSEYPVNYILKSSDIGKFWSIKNKLEKVNGEVLISNITDFGHSELIVNYFYPENIRYSDGDFDKREISLFNEETLENLFTGKVIYNDSNKSSIIIFDKIANEIIAKNKKVIFTIYPVSVNSVIETEDNNILYGNDIGIFEDKRTTVRTFPIEGEIKSVGKSGYVVSIDTSGVIRSVYENEDSGNAVLSIFSESKITINQFKNKSIYILNLEVPYEIKILNNSERNSSGELNVEVDSSFTSEFLTYIGKNIKLVGENSILDVDFILPTYENELKGGKLTVSSNENFNYDKQYEILSNSINQIIVQGKITPHDASNINESNKDIIPGQRFTALDSSGKLEIKVILFSEIANNELADFKLKITNENSNMFGLGSINIHKNSRNTIVLDNFENLTNLSIGNSIKPNDTFTASGEIYQPLPSFNNKKTSIETYHYHDIDTIGSFMVGDIDDFISSKNSIVEFTVSNSDLFNSFIVQKDNSLFRGGKIRFYNPNNIGIEYYSEIIEHSINSITVKIVKKSSWDFESYSTTKISRSWKWEIDARNYGFTKNIYYKDIPISSHKILEDISSNDEVIKIEDTSYLNINDKILISSSNKNEENIVKSIIDSNYFRVKYAVQNSFFTNSDSYIKVLSDDFSNFHEHMIRNNQIQRLAIEDYNNLGISISHSHRSTGLIESVFDIKKYKNSIIVAGTGSKIYSTNNSGLNWAELVDLDFSLEEELTLRGVSEVETSQGQIIVGTMSGRIFSNKLNNSEILPLINPKI